MKPPPRPFQRLVGVFSNNFRFAKESDAPIVFGENVVLRAISKAESDLESVGYRVESCGLSCSDLGADHRRNRFWLLAVKDEATFERLKQHILSLPVLEGGYWSRNPNELSHGTDCADVKEQLKGVGNAQSPFVAATAFRILVNRHVGNGNHGGTVSAVEIARCFKIQRSWIEENSGGEVGLIHTPTTMANYSAPSMMEHQCCRSFKRVFGNPTPSNAEYLMGFPLGASSTEPQRMSNLGEWSATTGVPSTRIG